MKTYSWWSYRYVFLISQWCGHMPKMDIVKQSLVLALTFLFASVLVPTLQCIECECISIYQWTQLTAESSSKIQTSTCPLDGTSAMFQLLRWIAQDLVYDQSTLFRQWLGAASSHYPIECWPTQPMSPYGGQICDQHFPFHRPTAGNLRPPSSPTTTGHPRCRHC